MTPDLWERTPETAKAVTILTPEPRTRGTAERLRSFFVRLEIPHIGDSKDAYGRTLAYV